MSDHTDPLKLLVNFAQLVFRHLGLPPLTPCQKEICHWLQFGPKRNQTWAFRGIGKSYLCSIYCLWLLYWNANEKILVISASKERADAFVQFSRRLIGDMPMLSMLLPNRNRGDRDSSVSFDVGCCVPAHSPSLKAMGVTGQLAGSRGSTIVLDDIEVPANSGTPMQRERLAEAVKEVDAVLLPEDKELGVDPKVRVLGTPQSMETVYSVLEERGYVPRIWPIVVPEPAMVLGYRGNLAPSIQKMVDDGEPVGEPCEPTRFHREDIQERRMSYGALGFALQFMLSTALSDAEKYPLKIKDAIFAPFQVDKAREFYVHSNHPQYRLKDVENIGMQGDGFYQAAETVGEWVPFQQTCVFVDPSGRGKDETAVISASQQSGQVFVHRVFGTMAGYDESTLEAIANEASRVKASRIVIEANYGDGMFSQLLRPVLQRIYPCTIEEIKHSTVKERRIIDTVSPVLEAHRIVFHESIPMSDRVPHAGDSDMRSRDRQLFYQMTHLTDERGCLAHDDRLDCLAMAVAHFASSIAMDARAEMRLREQEQFRMQCDRGLNLDTDDSWLSSNQLGAPSLLFP